MFEPILTGHDMPGIHTVCLNSLISVDDGSTNTRDIYQNICLTGGNTMFEGFADRLRSEIA